MVNITDEKFSAVKFMGGFGKWYKVLFIVIIILGYDFAKSSVLPRIKNAIETQNIETFIEAPEYVPDTFTLLKIGKLKVISWAKE